MAALPEDELAPFVLPSVEGLRVGEKKGSGAYGTAHRVTVDGVPCIAKRIHEILQDQEIVTSEEKDAIQRTFRQECIILSRLRHSNVVRFVGVHYGRDNELSLVMECLYTDLGKCLDTHHANKSTIPLSVKIAILLDISSGLLYLHSLPPPSGPVIHRDLSAGNVLLTIDMRAKIADLGVSKLLSRRAQTTMKQTKGPGTIDYMPPEAMEEIPKYDTKLDVFSFGHLTLYTTNQKIPPVFEVGRSQAMRGIQQGILQILRRGAALEQMGERHCLYSLTRWCLQDDSVERPSTQELHARLTRLSVHHPKTAAEVMQACGTWSLSKFEMMMTEFKQLRKCLQATEAKEAECRQALSEREREHQNQLDQLLRETQEQLQFKNKELGNLQTKVEAKNTEIQQLTQRMQNMESRMKLSPTKRESVDERSIPQQRKRAPLPDWFKKLNGPWASLDGITVSDVEADALSENLRSNTTVQILMLWNVNVSDVGFTTLAEAMRDNQSLTELNLGETKISDGGVNALASAIHENNTLQTLVVEFKSVSDGGARDFAKKMERWGSSLKTLMIWSTRTISGEVKKLLRETARRKGIELALY